MVGAIVSGVSHVSPLLAVPWKTSVFSPLFSPRLPEMVPEGLKSPATSDRVIAGYKSPEGEIPLARIVLPVMVDVMSEPSRRMPYVPAWRTVLPVTDIGWPVRPFATMPSCPVHDTWVPVTLSRKQPVGGVGQFDGLRKLAMIP